MKLEMSNNNKVVVGILLVVAIALVFWMKAIGPKRDEASKLDVKAQSVKGMLAQHQAEIATAEEAKKAFPTEYQRLVVLGKAVPGDDDTASLLVQVNRIAKDAKVRFSTLTLSSGGEGDTTEAAPASGGSGVPVSPTEAAASTLPLGATVGPAGLGVMPYTLNFEGSFFQVADFIEGLDSLVKTRSTEVAVDGRLMTIDGFALKAETQQGFPQLDASFSVTTYLTPPGQGLGSGATSSGLETATPAATTLGG